MKRLMIAVGAAGALFAGAVVSAAPNASPSAAPASTIGSASTANAPAAKTGATSPQVANPAVVANVPAAPPLPSNANGCVWGIVSSAAHFWQQTTQQGLGDVAHDTGQNVGQAVQAAATVVCGKH